MTKTIYGEIPSWVHAHGAMGYHYLDYNAGFGNIHGNGDPGEYGYPYVDDLGFGSPFDDNYGNSPDRDYIEAYGCTSGLDEHVAYGDATDARDLDPLVTLAGKVAQ